jgi:branched-chain amino acid transport system permease protein
MQMEIWPYLALLGGATGLIYVMPAVPKRWRLLAAIALALAILCWAPFVLDGYRSSQMTRIVILAIALVGLNILTGYNGQISLGHGAFMLLGMYTMAILLDRQEQLGFIDARPWPFWAALIVATGLSAIAGLCIGVPALRLSGPYLAIASLALIIAFPPVVKKYEGLSGGVQGLRFPTPPPPEFLKGLIDKVDWLYFLALISAVITVFLAWNLLRGTLGRALVAVRDSEVAAAAMGVPVARTKVTAFTISAACAGAAGGLLALVLGSVTPETVTIVDSINLVVGIVIGGLASILGSLLGAFAIVFIPSDAADLIGRIPGLGGGIVERAPGAIQGAVVMLVMILMPFGVAGTLRRLAMMRPTQVAQSLRQLPAILALRAQTSLQRLSLAWDIRPWARRPPTNPHHRSQKGGGGD